MIQKLISENFKTLGFVKQRANSFGHTLTFFDKESGLIIKVILATNNVYFKILNVHHNDEVKSLDFTYGDVMKAAIPKEVLQTVAFLYGKEYNGEGFLEIVKILNCQR